MKITGENNQRTPKSKREPDQTSQANSSDWHEIFSCIANRTAGLPSLLPSSPVVTRGGGQFHAFDGFFHKEEAFATGGERDAHFRGGTDR